ncbi:MAG TPA: glycosyltransferase family 2 protein [Casimicrobiaceae bacterium]
MATPLDSVTRPGSRTVSVVVPVYFNAEALPELFERLCAVEAELAARDLALELIFVDDGSKDASQAELQKIRERRPATTVIELTRNFGVNAALRTGLRFVTGDCFAFLAADLQDPPHLVVDMVDRWLEGSQFVICERVTRDDPPMSRWLSRIYYFTLRKLVLPGYPAGGFDLALMDRSMLAPLRDSGKSAFLPLLAYWLGFEPSVLQYRRESRRHGRSRWTLRKKLQAFFDVLFGFSVTPIRAISAVGAVVSLVSFAYGAVVVAAALIGNVPVRGFSTIVALVTFLLGLLILMLGVIGEYLWRVFDATNGRPDAVVKEVHERKEYP